MKENNNIDELFRKGTEHHYPFDESLWAVVEGQLPPQPSKPFLWVFNLNSIALLMMLFVCATIPMDNTRANKPKALSLKTDHTVKPSNSNYTPNTKNNTTTNKTNLRSAVESNETTTQQNSNKTIPQNTSIHKENNQVISPVTKEKEFRKLENNQIAEVKEDASISTTKQQEISPTFSTQKPSNPGSFSLAAKNILEKQLKKENSQTEQKNALASQSSFFERLDLIPSFNFTPFISDFRGQKPMNTEKKPLPTRSKSYYLELETSRDLSIQKSLASSNKDLERLKQSNEKSISQSLVGLNLIKQYKSLIYGVGIQHTEYRERVNYIVDKESLGYDISYDTTYQLISGNFNSNGVPVFLIDQEINEIRSPTTVIVDDEIASINTFKRVGIPLFVGVQQDYKNWIAEVRTSLSFNYLYQSQGVYITDQLNEVESLNSGTQLESFVIGNKNDLSVGYTFHEQFAIGARYSLYRDLSSFTQGYESRISNQSVGVWILWKPE